MHPRRLSGSGFAVVCIGLASLLHATTVTAQPAAQPSETVTLAPALTVFAGGYGSGGVIRVTIASTADPRPVAAARAASMSSPTFLLAHSTLPLIYASSELSGGKKNIRILRPSGTTLATTWSGGANPVRMAMNAEGDRLVVANYDGSVALLALDASGIAGMPLAIARTAGSGPDPKRQASSHPHSVTFSASGRSVYVADLGADTIIRYELGPNRSLLSVAQRLTLAPGSGPRQVVTDGSSAYVANELSGSITTLNIGADSSLAIAGTTALPQRGAPGELLIDPSGRWMVVLVRGPDVCQVLEILPTGLRPTTATACGRNPRYAEFTVDGTRLLIASPKDGTIRAASFDVSTGALGPAETVASLAGAASLAQLA